MEALSEDVTDVIYKYKHQLEYAAVVNQMNQLNAAFSHRMFSNRLPFEQIVKPLGRTKDLVFETDIFDYFHRLSTITYIENHRDNIKDFNIKHRYYGHELSATIKLRIKFKNYQSIY